jgi:hypothetical protein
MRLGDALRGLLRSRRRHPGELKCFARELAAAGGGTSRVDLGMRTVPTAKIVGCVGRWQNLREDFFYKTHPAVTARYERIGSAMAKGTNLPPVELDQLADRRPVAHSRGRVSEYYVVDGHHRIAMARKLGQEFVDAHVVAYRVREAD